MNLGPPRIALSTVLSDSLTLLIDSSRVSTLADSTSTFKWMTENCNDMVVDSFSIDYR